MGLFSFRGKKNSIPKKKSDGVKKQIMQALSPKAAAADYYANPKNVVGHLPTSVNPGEQGAVWLFGHLESPFTREGAVLWDIPKLENELNNDNNINVILENDSNRFIYRVSSISIVEEAEFEIYQSDGSTLHIVTCYPRLKYDKRMIVNADLVGLDSIFD